MSSANTYRYQVTTTQTSDTAVYSAPEELSAKISKL